MISFNEGLNLGLKFTIFFILIMASSFIPLFPLILFPILYIYAYKNLISDCVEDFFAKAGGFLLVTLSIILLICIVISSFIADKASALSVMFIFIVIAFGHGISLILALASTISQYHGWGQRRRRR